MAERFQVTPFSQSAHCCFEATVVDTTKPDIINGEHYESDGYKYYEAVCECFDLEDATLIANALNAANPSGRVPRSSPASSEAP